VGPQSRKTSIIMTPVLNGLEFPTPNSLPYMKDRAAARFTFLLVVDKVSFVTVVIDSVMSMLDDPFKYSLRSSISFFTILLGNTTSLSVYITYLSSHNNEREMFHYFGNVEAKVRSGLMINGMSRACRCNSGTIVRARGRRWLRSPMRTNGLGISLRYLTSATDPRVELAVRLRRPWPGQIFTP
jgi:hypothetical protein